MTLVSSWSCHPRPGQEVCLWGGLDVDSQEAMRIFLCVLLHLSAEVSLPVSTLVCAGVKHLACCPMLLPALALKEPYVPEV